MKTVEYRRSWANNMSADEEMKSLFGELLIDEDTSEAYEQETSSLYVNDEGLYTWIDSNGCSCWDGDYEGWQCEIDELLTLAKKKLEHKRDYREAAEDLVAEWIVDNLDEKSITN